MEILTCICVCPSLLGAYRAYRVHCKLRHENHRTSKALKRRAGAVELSGYSISFLDMFGVFFCVYIPMSVHLAVGYIVGISLMFEPSGMSQSQREAPKLHPRVPKDATPRGPATWGFLCNDKMWGRYHMRQGEGKKNFGGVKHLNCL